MKRILILCTGNSARSQMAEGLMREALHGQAEVFSAGTKPSHVRPEAIAVMSELGIDLSGHRSKSVDEFAGREFDYVITVCDNANEACPVFPGKTKRVHWSFEDPAGVIGSEAERQAAFRKIRDQIRARIQNWVQSLTDNDNLTFTIEKMPMQPVNEDLLHGIEKYIDQLFVPPDAILEQNLKDADAAGLPAIAVAPDQGRLIYILAKITGAKRILEIGTLGGYSTTLLARALPKNGRLVTLEMSPTHAAAARKNLDRAGVGDLVEIRVGRACDTLHKMIEAAEEPFDLVFIDADKTGYVGYLNQSLQLSHPGTVILADNLIRHGDILQATPPDEMTAGVKAFNELIATHPRLESILLPILKGKVDGMSISRVK